MMHFNYWSYEKKKQFINNIKYKSKDNIYKALKEEGFELFPKGQGILAIAPGNEYYYFQIGLRERTEEEKELKKKYKHRYIIVRV